MAMRPHAELAGRRHPVARQTRDKVRTHVPAWRPNHDTSKNFRVRFRVEPGRRSRSKAVPTAPPRVVKLMQLADEWQRLLDTGEVRNRAELARREGVSGMWVTNVLALLNLHPEIQAWVRGLPPGTPERFVTERALREILRQPDGLQTAAARKRFQIHELGSPRRV